MPCYVPRRISEALFYISALRNSVVAASAAKSTDKLRDCGNVLIPDGLMICRSWANAKWAGLLC